MECEQLFALLYLDPVDRLVKEKLRIQHYVRYVDDCVLVHESREYLKECLAQIGRLCEGKLKLRLNAKTQIFPVKNGVDFLGFHTYLTETGAVIRKVRRDSVKRMKRKLKFFERKYAKEEMDVEAVRRSVVSWLGHAEFGNTYGLRKRLIGKLVLTREAGKNESKKR